MSASPDHMQQLLGGLLNVPQNGVTSGLLGGNDPTTNFGLQLLANSNSGGHFGQILGQSALNTQQQGMQNAMQRLQLAQGLQGLSFNMQKNQALMDALGGGTPSAQAPAPPAPAQPFYPGVSQMPAGQPSSQQESAPQQVAGYSATNPDISQIPIGGVPPQVYRKLAILQGKDPIEVDKEIRASKLQTLQQSVTPQLSALDTVIKSDKPTQYVQADPNLRAQWQQIAPKLGINPNTGFTDQNVRTAFGFARNQIAAQAQLPSDAPVVPVQTKAGPLGSIMQVDPISGKMSQVKGEEDLKQVIDPKTGQPILVPASKAAGMQPFNASMFGAANMSDQAVQFAADTYRTTGKFPPAFGRNPAMQAKVLERVAQDASANGDTAGAIAARGAALKANGMALDQVTKRETAFNVANDALDKNLTSLLNEYQKVGSSKSPLVNRAVRAWQQGVTGDAQTVGMVTYLNAVEKEYAKLNSGSMGYAAPSVSAQKDAHEVINKYMSQGGIEAVAQAMRGEAQNQKIAIQAEKQSLMGAVGANAQGGGTQTPIQPPAHTPLRKNRGWELHHDARGNWAYVSPDGKSFDPVS